MSRHEIKTDSQIISAGYDRMLNEFYGMIVNRKTGDVTYNTLYDDDVNQKIMSDVVRGLLKASDIKIPSEIFANIYSDTYE